MVHLRYRLWLGPPDDPWPLLRTAHNDGSVAMKDDVDEAVYIDQLSKEMHAAVDRLIKFYRENHAQEQPGVHEELPGRPSRG